MRNTEAAKLARLCSMHDVKLVVSYPEFQVMLSVREADGTLVDVGLGYSKESAVADAVECLSQWA
jgi:prefoldin subunit 5